MKPAVPEVIVTPRLVLRKARVSDLPGLHDVMRRPEAMRYWSTPPHTSLHQSREWLKAMMASPSYLSSVPPSSRMMSVMSDR